MSLSLQEKDNLTRWDSAQKGFYEVYYLKFNDLAQGNAAWLRYTLLAPRRESKREPEVSVWGIFFDAKDPAQNAALKQTYSIRDARIEKEIFYFAAGPSAIFESGARGEIDNGRTKMSWELKFEGEGLALRHLPLPLYVGPFPKTKILAPYLSTRLSGEFSVNGRRFVLERVPAHQAHLWGTEQSESWIWGNCNTFIEDSDACFEGLSARVRIGEKFAPEMTLLFLYWKGKFYRFDSPTKWFSNRSFHELDRWHFEAAEGKLRFIGDFFANPKEMIGVRYEDPQGGERFCHNTKIADLKIQILQKGSSGWECLKILTAAKSAAFEVVEPTHDPRVRLMIP